MRYLHFNFFFEYFLAYHMKINIILLIFSVLTYSFSFAQNWTGSVNSDWNNPANWSSTPSNGSDLEINPTNYSGAAASPVIASNSTFNPGGVLISNGAILTISANLTTLDDVEVLDLGSSIVLTNGNFSVNVNDGGRLIFDLGASMLIENGTITVGERFIIGEDAMVTMNNGTATSGERLILDLGGSFIQNGGDVNVAATFALADGNVNGNSRYTLNAGNLTVNGEMALENEFGDFEPTFTQNGGSFTLNGNLIWFGEAPGLGTPKCIFQDGNAFISGTVENLPLSTVHLYFKIEGNAHVHLNGPSFILPNVGDTLIIKDGGKLNFTANNTVSILNSGVFHAENGFVFVNGTANFQGNGVYQLNELFIYSTGTLSCLNTSPISISGDFSNSNIFNAGVTEWRFNGSVVQSIKNTLSSLNFYKLTIHNTSSDGVVFINGFNMDVRVANHFELVSGKLKVNENDRFIIEDNATASSGNSTSFVEGPMIKKGNDAFVFPVGKNSRWRRIGISAPTSISTEFQAEYVDNSYPLISPIDPLFQSVTNVEFWKLEQLVGTDLVQVELFWEDASSSGINDCSELALASWDGNMWNNLMSTTTGLCTGQNTGTITSSSATSIFNAFTFAFTSGVTTQNFVFCNGGEVTVGNNTYQNTGIYTDILLDQNMQDSIVVTNIEAITLDAEVVTAFDGTLSPFVNNQNQTYKWIMCEGNVLGSDFYFTPNESGVYALVITQNICVDTSECVIYNRIDTTICEGSVYEVGNSTYSEEDIYSNVFVSSNAMDSIVVSYLSVQTQLPNVLTVVDGITITSLANNGSFQWINCTDNSLVPNETNESFTPLINGSYAVQVTVGSCVDTSDCQLINSVGIETLSSSENVFVYPNPFNQSFTIELNNSNFNKLSIQNALGQLIEVRLIEGEKIEIDAADFRSGIYFIQLESATDSKVIKLVKN